MKARLGRRYQWAGISRCGTPSAREPLSRSAEPESIRVHLEPRSHGQSDRERSPGSIGGGTDPGRVFKGKKMPGHMGSIVKTLINVEIVKVDDANSLILVKGAVPGARNSLVRIYGTGI